MSPFAFARLFLAAAWIALACACLADRGPGPSPTGPFPEVPARDTAQARRLDSLTRANDSLRALAAEALRERQRLAALASSLPRLPVPMGTRYFAAPPEPAAARKVAAAQACKGEMDVFALEHSVRGVLGIDTVVYFDTSGGSHCVQQPRTTRETHARYLMDPASGEARERIDIAIAEDDALPRYRARGTGTIRMNDGTDLAIEEYAIDMALDNATRTPIWLDARLRLATEDGLVMALALTTPHPFRAQDFFPIWDDAARGNVVLSGPILQAGRILGFMDLYNDRSTGFRDAEGNPIGG